MKVIMTDEEAIAHLQLAFFPGADITITNSESPVQDKVLGNVQVVADDIVLLLAHLQAKRKLDFIKQLRAMFGLSLVDSKEIADRAFESKTLHNLMD
jgi:ribosomal protein L7/L12